MANAAGARFFYMVRCRDSSLYSGITADLEERVKKHNAGTGAKYTLTRRPVYLVYSERHDDVSAVMKRERQVKSWSKSRKEQLVAGWAGPFVPGVQEDRRMFEALSSSDPAVKYGAAKELLTTARSNPSALLPHTHLFVGLLESDNSILKWTAIDVVGCLAGAGASPKVGAITERLCGLLNSGKLITANHAISALAAIARTRPRYRARITDELLKVRSYVYETDECRNIAIGKVILGLESYCDQLRDRRPVLDFVGQQAQNPRNATRKKAIAFVKKYGTRKPAPD